MVVVAIGFVKEARSKRVEGRRESKYPPCREERDKGGAPSGSSYTKLPKVFSATRVPFSVTAIDAAGWARFAMASCRIENAREKTSSCLSNARSKSRGVFECGDSACTGKRSTGAPISL